jgi:hypothetical protein
MKTPSLNELSVAELLKLHGGVLEELNKRGVLRSQNNPTGDYAEYLAAKELHLQLQSNSKSGFDAVDERGNRVQIKGRRVTPKNTSRQLGVIRNLEEQQFDYLIGVIFDESYAVNQALKIPHGIIGNYAEFSKHQNGHILHLSGQILSDKRVEDITSKFAAA